MGSMFDSLFQTSVKPLFMQVFGDSGSIYRLPGGEAGEKGLVTAKWDPDPGVLSEEVGESVVLAGRLTVDESQDFTADDSWEIGGKLYWYDGHSDPVNGLREIRVRRDEVRRKKKGGERL